MEAFTPGRRERWLTSLYTFDTETCGLHGPIVLLQWALGEDGEVNLFEPWEHTVNECIEVFEMIANNPGGVIAFNLAFDWFHIVQMWTTLKLMQEAGMGDSLISNYVEAYAEFEPKGRDYLCLKPVKCHDIMLHARKGPYQSTMDRGDIRIRRVPTVLAFQLAKILEERIELDSIYFAKRKKALKHAPRWQVYDIENSDGEPITDFKDVVLKFHPSTALKALAADALKVEEDAILLFKDIAVDRKFLPVEQGFAPYARAIGTRFDWKGAWPDVIRFHTNHWAFNQLAREYAKKDVIYLQRLYTHFGRPPMGDDDSELAACVACVRWRGYKIDIEGVKRLKALAEQKKWKLVNGKRFDIPTAPQQARYYVSEHLSPTERVVIEDSTKRVLLEEISKYHKDCQCVVYAAATQFTSTTTYEEMMTAMENAGSGKPDPDCKICGGSGKVEHPGAKRAKEVLDARMADKEIELYDKLLLAGRFHASFNVIGALSSRMSGTDGLNAQGIKNDNTVRACFPLAFQGMDLCGGDFAGFEVTLAEACYGDPDLRRDLLTCENCEGELECKDGDFICKKCKSVGPCPKCNKDGTGINVDPKCKKCSGTGKIKHEGKAIHALFGVHVYPDMTYDQIKKTKGTPDDRYTRCKQAVFAMFYGGEGYTLRTRLGVDQETADEAYRKFVSRYKGVGRAQQRVTDAFCSMKQPVPNGPVIWHEPSDYVESMFGFRRYFTLENRICRALFDLAQKPPREWRDLKIRVLRRVEREQTAGGAVQSALFGAAFQIQSGNTRAAKNHEIQSSGAQITKSVQRAIWDLQPSGPHPWRVQPCNIHDEILCPTVPEYKEEVAQIVRQRVESFRPKVPLIKMEWKTNLKSWAEKG